MPYLIISAYTKSPFIDEKRKSYLFMEKQEADAFVADVPKTEVCDTQDSSLRDIFSRCFAAGAEILKERRGNNKEVTHSLREEELEKRFYNENLNANLARYLHTGNKEYLKGLRNCKMIIPVRIQNEPYLKMEYPVIYKRKTDKKIDKGKYAFLVFSDTEEYGKWSEKDNGWDPLLIDNEGMLRIGRKHGFMMNVYTSHFFITTSLLQTYIAPEEEEDDE